MRYLATDFEFAAIYVGDRHQTLAERGAGWTGSTADAAQGEDIIWWDEKPKANSREVVLWLEAEQFVVVLAWRSQGYWLLKTAYLATKPHKINSLRGKKERYWKARKS